jgi:hypothetical protein
MAGKGDRRRPRQITKAEEELRWELAFGKPSDTRKEGIRRQLEELQRNE